MPASIVQVSNRSINTGSVSMAPLTFNNPTTAGNSVLVVTSSYNATSVGPIIASVSDTASQSYQSVTQVNGFNMLAQLNVFLGYNLTTPITTINLAKAVTDARSTAVAFEVQGLMSSVPTAISAGNVAAAATTLSLTSPVPQDQHSAVFAVIGWYWASSPKGAAVPTGWTLVDQLQVTPTNTMGYQVLFRQSSTTRSKQIAWTFNAQPNGAQGAIVAYRSQPAVRRVRVPINASIINATNIWYEVYREQDNPNNPLGAYVMTGTLGSAPTNVYSGLVDLQLPVPETSNVVEDGDSAVVLLEATVGGQVMTNHLSRGYVHLT